MTGRETVYSRPLRWETKERQERDVVLSSRIRLARNLAGHLYPMAADAQDLAAIESNIIEAAARLSGTWQRIKMAGISDMERAVLAEQHIITPLYTEPLPHRSVLVRDDGGASIMIHEADHIRLQVIDAGIDIPALWQEALEIEQVLEESLTFSFSDTFGYLTSVPTEAGTGMSVSALVHLPGIAAKGLVYRLIRAVMKLGFAMKPFYGGAQDGSHIFYIASQRTFGVREEQELAVFEKLIMQIIEEERKARAAIEREGLAVYDRAKRACGLLMYAVTLTYEETLALLSDLKWGIDSGYIEGVSGAQYNRLMKISKKNTLLQRFGAAEAEEEQENCWRAQAIQEEMKAWNI